MSRVTFNRILSIAQFMGLIAGQELNTQNGVWKVISEPTRAGNVPRVLIKRPNSEKAEFVHYDEKNNIVVDDLGNKISDLSDGVMHVSV